MLAGIVVVFVKEGQAQNANIIFVTVEGIFGISVIPVCIKAFAKTVRPSGRTGAVLRTLQFKKHPSMSCTVEGISGELSNAEQKPKQFFILVKPSGSVGA